MKTLRETGIIMDFIRQGKILLDANKLKKSDLTSDRLLMLSVNDTWSDIVYCDTYYKFEEEISETLSKYRG